MTVVLSQSYVIRNAVLTIFCKLVLVVLSKEGLDNKDKELRDTLLEHLEVCPFLILWHLCQALL